MIKDMRLLADIPIPSKAKPDVIPFYEPCSATWTYLVVDKETKAATIIDPVLNYDAKTAMVSTENADHILSKISAAELVVTQILETHVHADHLSAAFYLKTKLGAPTAIGWGVTEVQSEFVRIYGQADDFATDGRQFDRLFEDYEQWNLGTLACYAFSVPGHTPACIAYLIGDALFVGDTLFMPDSGTARCDFPGGDAHSLYRSIQRIYSLPGQIRLFVCHDYPNDQRHIACESTVRLQRENNIHINGNIGLEAYAQMRVARDHTLSMPSLLRVAMHVNLRGGRLPRNSNTAAGAAFTMPLSAFGSPDSADLLG